MNDVRANVGKTKIAARSPEIRRKDAKKKDLTEDEEEAEDDEDEEEDEGDEEEEEAEETKVMKDPDQPSEKEWEEHRVDHWPFRSWCPHCVRGRATGKQHRERDDEPTVPTFGFDYLLGMHNAMQSRTSQ